MTVVCYQVGKVKERCHAGLAKVETHLGPCQWENKLSGMAFWRPMQQHVINVYAPDMQA